MRIDAIDSSQWLTLAYIQKVERLFFMRPLISSLQLKFRGDESTLAPLIENEEMKRLAKFRSVNGFCFIDFVPFESGSIFGIPDKMEEVLNKVGPDKVTSVIVVSEFGGFKTKDGFGSAQTVCGLTGKSLRPFFISDVPENNFKGPHAVFSVPQNVIICNASMRVDMRWSLSIHEAQFQFDPDRMSVFYNLVTIFNGSRFNETRRRYTTALAYAMAKAATPQCFGASFYESRERNRRDDKRVGDGEFGESDFGGGGDPDDEYISPGEVGAES